MPLVKADSSTGTEGDVKNLHLPRDVQEINTPYGTDVHAFAYVMRALAFLIPCRQAIPYLTD